MKPCTPAEHQLNGMVRRRQREFALFFSPSPPRADGVAAKFVAQTSEVLSQSPSQALCCSPELLAVFVSFNQFLTEPTNPVF
jgi:hypothetical protein